MPEMFVLPFRPAYDSNGRTIPGAQAWFTLTGTNTETPVYADSGLVTPLSNPLVADGLGKFPRAYLDPAIDYRCRVYEETATVGVDSPISDHDYDPYTGAEQGSEGPAGDAGVNATVISNTVNVSTLAAGASATASSASLGGGVYQLTLGIPAGAAGASGALSNGDYGDIVVSGSGATLTIDTAAVSLAKMANLAEDFVIGRQSAGAGVPEAVAIGTGAATSILDRAAGDGRYIQRTENRSFEIFIPAGAMKTRSTSGAAVGSTETTTNKINYDTFDFDQTSAEYVQFMQLMPKSWNESTVTMRPVWTADAGTATQTVIFGFQAVAISNDDALDAPFGTAQTSSDALIATGDQHTGPYTAAITIGGTPAESDLVCFQIYRDVSDTLAADVKLLGATLKFTVNAADDS